MGKTCSHDGCKWSPGRDPDDPGVTVAEEVLDHKREEHDGQLFPGDVV